MCCMYRKRSELFNLISTALLVALNTEGSEMRFNCIRCNVKLIQHRLIKFPCLKRCRINHVEMNERMSKLRLQFEALVESRKQLTSLLLWRLKIKSVLFPLLRYA